MISSSFLQHRASQRVLIAPDKFKGTLTGPQAARSIAAGVREVLPSAEIRTVVMADGGEGTVDAAISAGARRHTARVPGPLGEPVKASWAQFEDSAVVEIAAASGLQLLTPNPRTALRASTEGTGELIRRALDQGAAHIAVGLGGAASTDGAVGALRALGAQFLTARGIPLRGGGGDLLRIGLVDLSGLDPRLRTVPVTLLCDVRTPLLGPDGAAALFAGQKGADARDRELLEEGLRHLAARLADQTDRNAASIDWGGAAGGTSGGLYAALGARFQPGAAYLADLIGLDEHLAWADLVLTGEGSLDEQSLHGKAPTEVIARAAARGTPAVVVAGRITLSEQQLRAAGLSAWASARECAPDDGEALGPDAARWVQRAAERAVQCLRRTAEHPSPHPPNKERSA